MKTKLFIARRALYAAIAISSFFISCNSGKDKSETQAFDLTTADLKEPQPQNNNKEKKQIPVDKFSPPTDSAGSPIHATVAPNSDWDSKIIKTGTLKVEIKDFKKYNNYVHSAVRQYGAYVAQEEQTLSDEKAETSITIKVPVTQFEPMMNALPADDGKVMEKKITTDDVTGEVVDTKSRLEAKKQLRLKYLEFLKQSKNMEEVLKVQGEVDDIQQQIESVAGRVSFLSHQTAFSTINLSFYQPLEGYSKPTDEAPSFFTRLTNAFKTGGNWIAELFVGLVSIWPLLLVAFALYFGWKKLRPAKVVTQKS
ncbi:MAG: DUF4349 domain-containing protein [Chitinophagaceae bacterium]|nr:DUF4349 domain-containing protein [Chitinophagaceae bacterium]